MSPPPFFVGSTCSGVGPDRLACRGVEGVDDDFDGFVEELTLLGEISVSRPAAYELVWLYVRPGMSSGTLAQCGRR